MLVQRVTIGLLLIGGVAAVIWGDILMSTTAAESAGDLHLSCGTIIPLVILLLAMAGGLEAVNLVRAAGYMPMGWVVFFSVLLLNALAWMVPVRLFETQRSLFECQLIVLVLAVMATCAVQVARRRTERGIGDISASIMIIVYMGILPSFITAIRTLLGGTTGVWAVVLFIAVVKLTDIGAYFTGLLFGRAKLIPSISPAKTVEGLAGGIILGLVSAVILARFLPWPEHLGASPISPSQAAIFGVLIAAVGSVGDLVESVFKRDAASKDSSNAIPAFGGILDLLDSPAFAAPLGYLLLSSWLG